MDYSFKVLLSGIDPSREWILRENIVMDNSFKVLHYGIDPRGKLPAN